MHSAEGGRRPPRRDGGRAGAVPEGFRGGRGAGPHGRDVEAAEEGDTGSPADAARRPRRSRPRVRAERRGDPLHAARAAARPAGGHGHRQTDAPGPGHGHPRPRGRHLPRQTRRARDVRPRRPHGRPAVRDVPARGGGADPRPGWRSTTRRSTAPGRTPRRRGQAQWPASARTAAFPTAGRCAGRRRPGPDGGTGKGPP